MEYDSADKRFSGKHNVHVVHKADFNNSQDRHHARQFSPSLAAAGVNQDKNKTTLFQRTTPMKKTHLT